MFAELFLVHLELMQAAARRKVVAASRFVPFVVGDFKRDGAVAPLRLH